MRLLISSFGSWSLRVSWWAIAALTVCPVECAAQLKVIISGGFSAAYGEILPEFERATRVSVVTASGSSQGNGPTAIGVQLRQGILFDVVILNTAGLADLIAQGLVTRGTERELAQVPMGISVRAGRPPVDVSTADALAETLRRAGTIAMGASSAAWATPLLARLGIADSVNVKVATRYSDANAMVARGEAEVAIQTVSEILHMPGVELAGTIPPSVQPPMVFAAAIVAGSTRPDNAKRLIAFLSSGVAKALLKKNGMEPADGVNPLVAGGPREGKPL